MIAFLSGGYGPGGAQSIQLTLFKELIERGIQCKLFDLYDGWVHKTFIQTGLPFEFVEIQMRDKNDYSSHLTKNDLLIVFDTNLFGNMLLFSDSQCKVIVWEVYYPWVSRFIYTRYFPIKWLALNQEIRVLDLIVRNDAFYFIDVMGKELVESRLSTLITATRFLPIPIDNVVDVESTSYIVNDTFTISYVGRSVVWKIQPMVKVIADLISTRLESEVQINIVCDDVELFTQTLLKYVSLAGIKLNFFENLDSFELSNLLKKSDMHFSMGTAALDGAKLGIPTILIDGSYDIFPKNYRYRWIYETNDLNLGRIISKNTSTFDGIHALDELVTCIKKDKLEIGKKCQQYTLRNYHVSSVIEKIIESKKTSKLTMNMFNNLLVIKYFRLLRNLGIR
jgi:hypothetical protein